MSTISGLMDASQTYQIGNGGVPPSEIWVHDQDTWDNLTQLPTPHVKCDSLKKTCTYRDIPLRLKLDSSKTDEFTLRP